jgi:hypothetical protein
LFHDPIPAYRHVDGNLRRIGHGGRTIVSHFAAPISPESGIAMVEELLIRSH